MTTPVVLESKAQIWDILCGANRYVGEAETKFTSENELMKLSSLMGMESSAIQKALTSRTLHIVKEY